MSKSKQIDVPDGGLELAEPQVNRSSVPNWQTIIDVIDVSISVFDAEDHLLAWNKCFTESAEISVSDIKVGMPHVDVLEILARRGRYGPGDPRALALERRVQIHQHRGETIDEEFVYPSGHHRAIRRVWLDDGSFVVIGRDIGPHKNTEQQLVETANILKTIFETLNQPICVWNGEQRLVAWNDEFSRMTGFDPSQVHRGMYSREFLLNCAQCGLFGEGDPQTLAANRYDAIWSDELQTNETIKRSNGQIYDAVRGRLPDGGMVSIFNDVTDRERKEADLRRAKIQAEHANAVKTDFLANMSHELRTPLNAIIGFSELMMHSSFDDPKQYQEYSRDVHESAHILLKTINDLLDLSKIEAGKTEFRLAEVNLHDATQASIELVRRADGAARLEFENKVALEFPQLFTDEDIIRQVLLNLLSNAVKATPDGGRVSVSAELLDEATFRLTVSDTGIGMSSELLTSIFDPYDGSGNSYVRKEKGSGLGLSIVKRLVELHGGDVSIDTAPERGTSIHLSMVRDARRI